MNQENASPDQIKLVLAEIEAEQRAWIDLVRRLSPEQLTARPDGAWSGIDALIHITAWKGNALRIARMQAAADASYLDPNVNPSRILGLAVDPFNEELFASHRDWTLDQALSWSHQVNADLLAALATLPPERLVGGPAPHGACQWYGRPAIVHPQEHRSDLERRWGFSAP